MNRRDFLFCGAAPFAAAFAAEPESAGQLPPEMRERLGADPHRPQYHFLPPAFWMNDPNGPIYWRGRYHMFYQHNPNGAFWGNMHWGHAVSEDLIHWKHLPVALAPTPGGPDKDGVFSGCAVIDRGVPTLVFTGVKPEVQMIATSDDDMLVWKKYERNPVISGPPPGLEVTGFRDPCVWAEDGLWYMLIGSGIKGVGGAALLYQSKDLRDWEYQHLFCTGEAAETGDMWECPDFFPLGDRHVLIVSTRYGVFYFTGRYAHHRFEPEHSVKTSFPYYAPKSMLDGASRRILWGWLQERRPVALHKAAGWAGVMSLPRMLSILPDGTVGAEPIPELRRLRGKHTGFRNLRIGTGRPPDLKGAGGDCLEIQAEIEPRQAEEVGLRLRAAPNGQEETVVAYNRESGLLFIDSQRSALTAGVKRGIHGTRLPLPAGDTLNLRVFLDGSVVEAFANGRACLTERIYPTRADATGLGLFARGGPARFKTLDIWRLRPISKDRLTS